MNRGRLKRVHVTPEAIESWLVDGPSAPCETNLPDDSEIVDHYRSTERAEWVFVFESEEWEMLQENERIPKFDFRVDEQHEKLKEDL